MKKTILLLSAALLAFASCDIELEHPSEANRPVAADYEPVITVNQETNMVTFSLDESVQGIIPVWTFPKDDYSKPYAENGYTVLYATAGDYQVRMQVMNSNGISKDYVERTFHIENTLVNFDKYITILAGGENSSKEWRIKGSISGHMGCGEPGSDGLNWWSANPGDKESVGLYEDVMTFYGDGKYVYNPGPDGMMYVNLGTTKWSQYYGNDGNDYLVPVEETTTTYSFEAAGDDLYLVLGEGSLFAYISSDAFLTSPKFKIVSASGKTLELLFEDAGISWKYVLTSEVEQKEEPFTGFKYNAESNLWLPADADHNYFIYYAPNWAQLPDFEHNYANGEYTLKIPSATFDRWQAQFMIIPNAPVAVNAATNYDFSAIMTPSKDLKGVTLKLTDASNDGNFLFDQRVDLVAYEENVIYFTDLAGVDAENVKMVFDFGGNPDDVELSIKNIVLKDHAVDDGTVLPSEGEGENIPYGDDIWGDDAATQGEHWFSPGDWSGGLTPQITEIAGGYKIVIPDGIGGNEWQGQFKLNTSIPISASKKYYFSVDIETTTEISAMTAKMSKVGADTEPAFECFYKNNIAVPAFDKITFVHEGFAPQEDIDNTFLIFDLGRCAAGTEVTISNIVLKESL